MIKIAGNLLTPDNVGIEGATIRFTSTANTSNGTVKGTMSTFTTETGGAYSEDILPGSYKVEFKNPGKDKYIALGYCMFEDGDYPDTGVALQDLGISEWLD